MAFAGPVSNTLWQLGWLAIVVASLHVIPVNFG